MLGLVIGVLVLVAVNAALAFIAGAVLYGVYAGLAYLVSAAPTWEGVLAGIAIGIAAYYYIRRSRARKA